MSTILKIFILGVVSIQCLATEPYGLSGVWVGQGIMIIKDQNITEKCNMNLEIGEQGNAKALSEFYTKFTLGFTLNDQLWFARPKYN